MAYSYALGTARASSAGNPITASYTVAVGDSVIVLLIKTVGATVRAGASPSLSGGDPINGTATFTQASSTQKAAASPEASAEMWYFLNPIPGTYTLTIPNTSAFTLKYTVVIGRTALGSKATFIAASGSNNTSTNPTPTALTLNTSSNITFAITAGGWDTWAPSAQIGTIIANTDDGTDGGGEQYILNQAIGSLTLSWTFGTSDDWGAVAAAFGEIVAHGFNNQMSVRADNGISVNEKMK